MEKLFTREGIETAATHKNAKGQPGIERIDRCHRCGGAGGFKEWPGFTCFRCRGNGKEFPKFIRLYTDAALVKLNASQTKREAKKEVARLAKLEAEAAIVATNTETFNATYAMLLTALADLVETNAFVKDVVQKGRTRGTLTDNQFAALQRSAEKREADVKAAATSKHLGTVGQRISTPVTVTRVASYERTGFRGGCEKVWIITMEDASGNQIVSKTPRFEATVGEKFTVAGTVKEHATYQGVAQTVVSHVKQS